MLVSNFIAITSSKKEMPLQIYSAFAYAIVISGQSAGASRHSAPSDHDRKSMNNRSMVSFVGFWHNYYNHWEKFLQSMEWHRMMGVDHFVVYVESVGKDVQRLIEYYRSIGILDAFIYQCMPSEPTVFPYYPVKSCFGLSHTFEDAIRRYMFRYRFLSISDVDENFYAYNYTNLVDFLEDELEKDPTIGSFLFLWDWFVPDSHSQGGIPDWTTLTLEYNKTGI